MDSIASPLEVKQRADELYAKQDYAAAAEEYRTLVQMQPASTAAMKQLGLALTMSKQVDEGVKTLQVAAAMQPADPEIRYAYGYALGSAGKFDEAIEELDAALNLQPNHIPARQGLVFCLLTSGQALAQVTPHLGEQRLDRAQKLDPRNAHVAAAYLDFLAKNNQKGKAVNFLKDLDAQIKAQSPLKELIEKLESDPDFSVHLKQATMVQQSAAPSLAPQAPGNALKQVPCPACKLPIMDYAAICPHCHVRIRATGTFAGRDTGPRYEWQEIAYTIMAILWLALISFDLVQGFPSAQKEGFTGLSSFLFFFSVGRAIVVLGVLFRQEWLAFIAKIMCYITLFFSGYSFMIFMGLGSWLGMGLSALQLAVAGFMVYLINYVTGE